MANDFLKDYKKWVFDLWQSVPFLNKNVSHKDYSAFIDSLKYTSKPLGGRAKEYVLVTLFSSLVNFLAGLPGVLLAAIATLGAALGALIFQLISAVLSPFILLIFLALYSIPVFIVAKILGGKAGLGDTYNALLLSSSAFLWLVWPIVALFSLIAPVSVIGCVVAIGSLILWLYSVYLSSYSVASVHKFSAWKGFVAFFVPLVLIGLLLVILLGALLGTLLASFSTLPSTSV